LAAIVVAAAFGVLALPFAAASCTVFNGVVVPNDDAAVVDPGADAGDEDGDGGGADACTAGGGSGYLSLPQAAVACRYIADCDTGQIELDIESSIGIVTSETSYAYCMNVLAGTVSPTRPGLMLQQQTFQCMANATSCATAHACLAIESIDQTSDSRCVSAGFPIPDAGVYCGATGNDIVDCLDGVVEHCNAPEFGSGIASCAIDPNDPTDYTCGEVGSLCPTEQASCDIATNVLTDCGEGTSLQSYVNCTAYGQACGEEGDAGGRDAATLNACVTEGKYQPCDATTFRDGCVGDGVATCNYFDTISITSCTDIGKTCNDSNAQPYCAGASDECSPFSLGVGLCNGTVISLCIDGKNVSFDCACAGMVCGGTGGIGTLHCVPP
jgi:hypothetical protein